MTWAGGFTGVGFTRDEFRMWLNEKQKPHYDRVVIHNTDAPYIRPPTVPGRRINNLAHYYQNELKWSGGPDFFVFHDKKIYPGSPMGHSVGCKGWNGNSFHIEAEGKYTPQSMHDPFKNPDAIAAWDTMAWITADLLQWMGWEANGTRIKLHKEGNTTHQCPGSLIHKDWFIEKVKAHMTGNPFYPENYKAAPVVPKPKGKAILRKGSTAGDVPNLQLVLKHLGYYKGMIDGDFGKITESAVKAFQDRAGLKADGVVGPLTWSKLALAVPIGSVTEVEPSKPVPQPKPEPDPEPQRQPIATMHVSKKGLDMIKHFEGLRLEPYWDNGELAIGYGHANHSKRAPVVTEGMRISEEDAERILASDLLTYEDRVKQLITVPLFQHEFDSLVSLAFNWGPGNLERSTLRTMVNEQRWGDAKSKIASILPSKDKKYYLGILRRRIRESEMFAGKI